MSFCRTFQAAGVTGTFQSPAAATKGKSSSYQMNFSTGATYDIKLLISNDGVNYITYVGSERTGLDSSTPEGESVIYAINEPYAFLKVEVEVLTGSPDIEGFLR